MPATAAGRVRRSVSPRVNIPPDRVETGIPHRLAEKASGLRGARRAIFYIFIEVKEHELFQRDGSTCSAGCPYRWRRRPLAATSRCPPIDGAAAGVKIPEGQPDGRQMRLCAPRVCRALAGAVGDMFIELAVETARGPLRTPEGAYCVSSRS